MAKALAAGVLVLLVIGGGSWSFVEWQRSKAERARILAEADAMRQEAARRDGEIAAERAKAQQALTAAEAEKKRAEDEARRAGEGLRKKEETVRQAAVPPPPPPGPIPAPLRAQDPARLDGLYAGRICYGATAKDHERCYRAQATVVDGRITGRWPGGNPGTNVILTGLVSASGNVQIEIHGENADKPRVFVITLSGSVHDGRLDATGAFANGRSANLNWRRQ
jgi:hypothetical protein